MYVLAGRDLEPPDVAGVEQQRYDDASGQLPQFLECVDRVAQLVFDPVGVLPGLEPADHLADGRAAHLQPLGDPCLDDVDIVLGNLVGFTFGKADTGFSTDTWVEVWENRTPREDEAATANR